MSSNSCKILFNGMRNAYTQFNDEFRPTSVEPSTFKKIYLVVAHSKASSYSEGLLRKQIEKIISGRFPLKETEIIYTVRRIKKAFITTAEYWYRQHRVDAQNDYLHNLAESTITGVLRNYWGDPENIVNLIETAAQNYPDLIEKYRPYLVALNPAKYQFLDAKTNILCIAVHRSRIVEARSYATQGKYSFKMDELSLWPNESRMTYSRGASPVGNRVVVMFGAEAAKRLVIVRMKAINWLDEAS